MASGALYLPLHHLHVAFVSASVALFAARGAGVMAGAAWPMTHLPRAASVAIDTLLLASGAALWALLGLNPLRQTWLGAKLLLLLVYIVLGTVALRRGRTRGGRALALAAALATVGMMVGVALAHDPRGWFAP